MTEDLLSLSFSSNSTLSDNNLIIIPIFNPREIFQEKKIFSIIGIGDPIVDIISEINEDIIKEHELKLGDSIFASEDDTNNSNNKNIEMFNILESMPSINYVPGGSVQNTLRVLSWNLINDNNERDTFKISMLGSVGDDEYKNKILNSLEDIGVNPILEILNEDKTSRCGVGIYKKERFLITQLRASKKLSEEFIQQNLEQILSNDSIIIEGYMLPNKLDICKKLTDCFSREKKLVILTLSAMFIVQYHSEKIMEIAHKADMIVGNINEAEILSGIKSDGNNVKEIFENIFLKLAPRDRLLVFTAGSSGVYCAQFDYKRNQIDYIFQYFANKINNDDIVDLNGAGDSFLGGFLSEYLKGSPIYECCKIGTEAASVVLRNVGCTFPKNMKFDNI